VRTRNKRIARRIRRRKRSLQTNTPIGNWRTTSNRDRRTVIGRSNSFSTRKHRHTNEKHAKEKAKKKPPYALKINHVAPNTATMTHKPIVIPSGIKKGEDVAPPVELHPMRSRLESVADELRRLDGDINAKDSSRNQRDVSQNRRNGGNINSRKSRNGQNEQQNTIDFIH
jgi:hypothetical protein